MRRRKSEGRPLKEEKMKPQEEEKDERGVQLER